MARAIGMAGNPAWETDEAWAACCAVGAGANTTFGFGADHSFVGEDVCVIGPVLGHDLVEALFRRLFAPDKVDASTLGPQGYSCFQVCSCFAVVTSVAVVVCEPLPPCGVHPAAGVARLTLHLL